MFTRDRRHPDDPALGRPPATGRSKPALFGVRDDEFLAGSVAGRPPPARGPRACLTSSASGAGSSSSPLLHHDPGPDLHPPDPAHATARSACSSRSTTPAARPGRSSSRTRTVTRRPGQGRLRGPGPRRRRGHDDERRLHRDQDQADRPRRCRRPAPAVATAVRRRPARPRSSERRRQSPAPSAQSARRPPAQAPAPAPSASAERPSPSASQRPARPPSGSAGAVRLAGRVAQPVAVTSRADRQHRAPDDRQARRGRDRPPGELGPIAEQRTPDDGRPGRQRRT